MADSGSPDPPPPGPAAAETTPAGPAAAEPGPAGPAPAEQAASGPEEEARARQERTRTARALIQQFEAEQSAQRLAAAQVATVQAQERTEPPRRRIGQRLGLAIVALNLIAAAGVLYYHLGPPLSREIDLAAASLPLAEARQTGSSVSGVIAEPRWGTMSNEERTRALRTLYRELEAREVRTLSLRDPQGKVYLVAIPPSREGTEPVVITR